MTIRFMRIIDDYIGMWICMLLGLAIRIKCFFFPRKTAIAPDEVRTILCQKYLGMGSTINAIPLIKGLKERYPNAKIIFMTTASGGATMSLCKMADEVLLVSLDSFGSFTKDVLKNLLYLYRKEVDISIDLEFFAKFSMLVSLLSMAKIRVGLYHRRIRPDGILTHKIYYNPYKHISEIYFAYARALGIQRKPEYFKQLLPPSERSFREALRNKLALKENKPIIIINVNAGDLFLFRRWPAGCFVELIQLLMSKYPDFYYVLIGGKSDINYVQNICGRLQSKNENLVNCTGQTTLEELFALIEMSYLIITNDSGPMHIAASYGINTVAFFGPETPMVYGPSNKNSLVLNSNEPYCSPCMSVYDSKKCLFGETCEDNICLSSIDPKYALRMIETRFLNENIKDKI